MMSSVVVFDVLIYGIVFQITIVFIWLLHHELISCYLCLLTMTKYAF